MLGSRHRIDAPRALLANDRRALADNESVSTMYCGSAVRGGCARARDHAPSRAIAHTYRPVAFVSRRSNQLGLFVNVIDLSQHNLGVVSARTTQSIIALRTQRQHRRSLCEHARWQVGGARQRLLANRRNAAAHGATASLL
jgi:hypothetical protein